MLNTISFTLRRCKQEELENKTCLKSAFIDHLSKWEEAVGSIDRGFEIVDGRDWKPNIQANRDNHRRFIVNYFLQERVVELKLK